MSNEPASLKAEDRIIKGCAIGCITFMILSLAASAALVVALWKWALHR